MSSYHRLPQQPCEHCGVTFSTPVRTKRFCSDRCRGKAYHLLHGRPPVQPRPCGACGEVFTPLRRRAAIFCSDRCTGRAWERRQRGLPVGPEERRCWWCDASFTAVRYAQRCCSDACRRIVTSLSGHQSRYGVSPERYRDLWRAQGGRCAICQHPGGRGRAQLLCVDHAHDDGHVRGLLCDNCNRAIGLLGDSPHVLDRAATYLHGAPLSPSPA